jgi:hypothetical protein
MREPPGGVKRVSEEAWSAAAIYKRSIEERAFTG